MSFVEQMSQINYAETRGVMPLIEVLRKRAWKETLALMRDVSVTIAASPYHAMDVPIIFWKNLAMMIRIMEIYMKKPNLFAIFVTGRDVLSVVALISVVDLTAKFVRKIKELGLTSEDNCDAIVQCYGASLVPSIA